MEEDNINIKVLDREGKPHNLKIPTDMGLNLMEACKSYELPVEGICGGMAMCASCHLYILSDHFESERNYEEQAMLDETNNVLPNSRLGCQILIEKKLDGMKVELAPDLVNQDNSSDNW
jgi:2Fe-2S ferredoxin